MLGTKRYQRPVIYVNFADVVVVVLLLLLLLLLCYYYYCCCCCYQVDGDASKDVPRRKDEHGTRGREPLNVILVESSRDDAECLKDERNRGFKLTIMKNNEN